VLVAENDHLVTGYVFAAVEGYDFMSLRGPALILHDLIVDPDYRRQGIGRLLLDAAAIPYVVMGRAFDFVHATNDVLTERGITLPLDGQ